MISGGDASFGNVFIAGTLRYTSIVSSETTLQGNTDVSNINIVGNTNLFNLNTTGNASFNNITTYGPNRFNGFTIFTSDVSINGIYRNFGNVFLQNNLNVLGDSSFNGNISNYGSTNLYGTSIMYTDASVNRILYANQIRSQTTNQTVNFMCDTSFNNMSVYGNISAFNNATIKDISLNGNFVSNGTSLLRGKFDVVGDSSLNMLNVHGTSVFNQLLIGAQDVSLNRNLSVFGNTNITNSLNVMGDGSFNNMLIRQNAAINNNLTVLGDASFITLNTSMPAKLNSVEVWNDASFNGNLKLADALYIGQNYYQFKNSSQRLLFPPLNLTSQALNSYITVSFWAYLGTKYTIDSNSILLLNDNKFLETRLNGTWYLSNTSSPQQTYTFDTGIFNLHTFVIPISTSGNISTSSFKAYLNGSILYTFTPTIAFIFNTSNNVFSFGNIPANFINNDLRVRDFRVYRGELTAQNIASLRNGTYNDTTNLIYIDTRLPFNNLKTYAYTNLYVSSDAQINQNLNVLGDASMNGNVSINTLQSNMIILSGDASLNGQVRMSGNLINNGGIFTTGDISGNTLSISNNARIMGNLFSNSLLATTGDASFNRLLNVGGNTVLNQRLLVLGDVSMNNANILGNSSIRSLKTTVFNSDDASFNKDVQIFGNTQISRSLIGHGDSSLNTLFVSGGSQHNSGMIVNKDASFNNNLSVSGLSRFNNVRVVGDASLTNLFVDGTAYFKNISVQASANGDASFNGTLSVRDEAYLNKSLTVATDTSTNTLFVSGFTRVLGGLSIGRDASFNSNMYIDGNTNIKSRLTIQGDSSANTLFVSGPSVHNSTLYVNRDASFNSNLLVRGNAIYGQKMDIYGDTSLNNLIVNGQIQLSQGLVASRDVSFNAGLAVGGNTNIGNNLSLGGDASFNKTLLTGGNTRIGGNAVIVGDSSFNGQLIIGGNTLLKQKLNVLEDATLSRNVVIGDNNMYCSYNSGTSTIQFTSLSLTSPTYTLNSYITISFWVYISSAWGPTDSDAATLLRVNGTTNFILWSTSKWIFANTLNSFTIPRGRYSLITIVYPLSDSGSVSSNSTFLYINDVLTGTYTLPNKYVTNVASTFNIGPFGNAVNASNIFVKDFRVFNYRLTYTDIYNLYNNTYTSTASAGLLQHYPLTSINSNQAITSTKNMVSNAFDGTLTSIIHKYIYSTSTEVVSDMIVRGNINTTANMITGGDLQISGNTSLYATNIQSSLIVSNDSSFNSNVYVQRNTRIDGNLRLFGDASMNGSLLIRGNAANSAIWATGDVSLNGLLTTTSNARILRQLYVGNDINTDGSMIIIGNGQINRNMAIYGDASINSILYVRGQSILQNRLTLTDDASFNKNTFILGNSRIFGRLDISQNIIVDGSLNLAGNANIMNNLFVNTDISANRNINIGGNTRILGNGIIHGDVSFNQNLNLGGNSVLRGTLTTVGDVSFNKTLSVYGNTYFDKMIIVNGDLSLNGIFKQAGTVGYDSISITNNMTVGRDATINGNAILNGNVDLSGNANFRSNLNVVNNTITRGSIFVWNDLSLNGNANVFGNINLNRRLFVSGDSSFNAAIFTGDVSLNRTLYVNGVSTIAGNNDVRGNINVENDVRIKGNIVTENNTVLKGNTNIDKYLTVALDSSMNNLTVSNNARIGNSIIASGNIISMVDISSNGNLYVKGNTNIVGNLVIGNAITTTDLSVTGSLLLKGQNIFTTENNWSGKNNFMDISLNNLTIVGNIRSPVTIDNYQDISGGVLTESLGTVDAANTRNIYTRYGPNGSTAKWSYLRQIETGNKYKLAWDFHNDNSCNMVFRSMNSLNNPDATPLTRFEINNGSIGLNGANVNHGNGGLFFDESIQNRKIILSQGANNNDYQFFGVGLQPSTMQFMSPNIDASFTFSYATSNNAKTDSAVISNKGVDIKTGSLLLAGTDLFARNNNWSGTNTFSNSILSNTSGTNKTITTTQLGYLSDLSMSFLDAFNTRPVYNQLIGQTNTWTGNNTFSNNLQLNKSLGVGSGAVIQDNSGIYFSNDSIHRKIVLQSSLAGTGNEFQNYSIGVKSNTTQFLVPNIDASYTFSYATTNNAKTDCVIISNNGLDIKRGNLLLDGSNILQRNNTWTGINTFTGNISANSQTVTPTQISYLSGVTSNIQTQINSKNSSSETLTALNVNNTTISGANSWSSQNIFNGLLKLTGNLNVNSVDVTPTQLGYLSGVTSSIQTQIDGKTTLTAIQANNNTWSGTNTFNNNNVQINKSLGIGTNALIQDNSGVYFSNDFINRKIVLYTFNYLISNECQNYSIGVQPNTTQFLVPNIDASFTFSYGTAANTKIDCVIISNNGLDIKRGNLLLDGSNILQRNNTWSGINTFSGNLSVNSQTVTPTQIGYLSGVTSSIQTQIDGKTTLAAIQANNNTWSGTNTFNNNNVQMNKSLGIGSGAVIQDNSGIYFSNDSINRKIVLQSSLTGTGNEFQNYSIGVKSNTTQFLVPNMSGSYTFSYATSSTAKTDCVIISDNGLDLKRGGLMIDGSNIFHRINSWYGWNFYNGNFQFNGITVTSTQLSYVSGVTSNIQTQLDGKTTLAAIQANNNTWTGTNTFSGNLSVNLTTVTPTQISYLSGVTSNIQTQLDSKVSIATMLANNNTWTGTNTFNSNHVMVSKSIGIGTVTPYSDNAIYFSSAIFRNRLIVLSQSVNNDFQFYGMGIQSDTFQLMVAGTSAGYLFSAATGASSKMDYVKIDSSGLDVKNGNLMLGGTNILERNNTWSGTNTFNNNHVTVSKSIRVGTAPTPDVDGAIYFPNTITNRKIVLWPNGNNEFQIYSIGIQSGTMQFMVADTTAGFTFSGGLTSLTKMDYVRIDALGLDVKTGNLMLDGSNILQRNNAWTGYNNFNSLKLNGGASEISSGFATGNNQANTYIAFAPNGADTDWCNLRQIGGNNQMKLAWDFWDDSDECRMVFRSNGNTKFEIDNGAIGLNGATIGHRDGGIFLPSTSTNRKIVFNSTANNDYQFNGIGVQNPSGTAYNSVYYVPNTSSKHSFMCGTGSSSDVERFFISDIGVSTSTNFTVTSGDINISTGALKLGGTNILDRTNTWTGKNIFGCVQLDAGTSPYRSETNTYIAFGYAGTNNDYCNLRQIGGDNQMKLAWDFWDDGDECRMVYRSNGNTKFEIDNGSIGLNGATIRHTSGGIFFDNALISRKIVLWSNANNDYQFNGIGLQTATFLFNVNHSGDKYRFTSSNAAATGFTDFAEINLSGITSASFRATSDRRLKNDLQPLESQLNKIKKLTPYHFTWKESQKQDFGFIAQEVFQTYPNMNSTDYTEDEPIDASGNPVYYSMDYGKLTTCLWKGLQETLQIVDTQHSTISILEQKVDEQQHTINTQQQTINKQQEDIETMKKQIAFLIQKIQ
jgi:cytoskeletal protein CcmA (bactofilin family)